MEQPPSAGPKREARKPLPHWVRVVGVLGAVVIGLVIATKLGVVGNGPGAVSASAAAPASPRTVSASGPTATFEDGVYEVGRDIFGGSYAAPGGAGSGCYWKRSTDPSDGTGSIIANDYSRSGQVIVTVQVGEFLHVRGCGTWTRR